MPSKRRPRSEAKFASPTIPESPDSENAVPQVLEAPAIFAPLPPIPWVCEAIELAPGAPTLLAGYGYSGKTLLVQDLGLAVAAHNHRQRAWGGLAVRHGRVVHLDYEQGAYLTRRRYQRLAAARGLGADDVDLALVVRPTIYIDRFDAEDWLVDLLAGATLAIVDPLRAAAPNTEENSSAARVPLDVLARVSEQTGCAILVIHHARKPTADAPGGARMSIRGSSALYDACQSVLVAEGEPGRRARLSHVKAKLTGREADPMLVAIDDVDAGTGLVVSVQQAPAAATSSVKLNDIMPRVLDVIRAHPSIGTVRLRTEVGGKVTLVDAAVEALVEAGQVRDDRRGSTGPHHYLVTPEVGSDA